MNCLLFLLATSLLYKESLGIYGGCMSYSTMPSNIYKHVKIDIFFLNGWKLHKGPCYNCTERDEGHDVTDRRELYIQDYKNPMVFGSWGFEPAVKTGTANRTLITSEVNKNVRDIVLMVNIHEQWEMESSKITMDIDLSTSYNGIFDITFESGPDVDMTWIPNINTTFLQVKVDASVRTDTKKPNNSPVVLVKPYYSLELGKDYKLHIPVIDNDGDQVHCDLSNYLEAKSFTGFLNELIGRNVLTMDNKACILMITVGSPTFKVGDTFGIPVTLKDYGREDTVVGGEKYSAYKTPFGRISVFMYFKVTDTTHPPQFVKPTPPNNQQYNIYVGGDFHVNVYAKATLQGRSIRKFNFLRRDGKPVNQTKHVALWDPNVHYISMSWSPVNDDQGYHIICANAEDSAGVSTVELHCFRIEVKANLLRPNQPIQGKPYYASFPEPPDIICPVKTYCRFPVYAATTNVGDIVKDIVSTTESKENVTIDLSRDVIYGNQSTTVAQVEFFADRVGVRQICLNASDTLTWTTQCLYVTVQKPDPCASVPCLHGGLCSPSEDNSGFQCFCNEAYAGQVCVNATGPCDREKTPCFNSNCRPLPLPPLYICTECEPGKTGFNCDIDIDLCHPNNCSVNEICHQSGKDFNCLPGNFTDLCPMGCSLNTSTVCVENKCVCAMGMKNDGVCKKENNLLIDHLPHFVSPTPGIGSVITCAVDKRICHFPIYISSGSVPCALVFNNTIDSSIQSINFSPPQKDLTSDLYQITLSIKRFNDPVPSYKNLNICLNVAKHLTCHSITDKRCFHIAIKAVPVLKENEKKIPKQYPGCSFSVQTPQQNSVIGCKKGNHCHFYMYAETTGTCPSLITHDIHTGIYTPVLSAGLCRYEVVYTNTSTVGRNSVCFMLCSKGESRCYQMFTNDFTDQCSSNPCKNDAYCQITLTGSLKCHCQEGYQGFYCEKGFCRNNNSCQNGAACLMNLNETECVCRPGFIGDVCSQTLNQNSANIMEYGGHFTMVNRLEKLTCYINGQCTVPFSIIKTEVQVPKVEVGHFDKMLEVQSIVLEKSGTSGGLVNGILTIVGQELGEAMMCLDSLAITRGDRIEDEICFRINVTEVVPIFCTAYSSKLFSYTMLRCYLNVWAKNQLGISKCPLLVPDKSLEDGVYVFPLEDVTSQPCRYDISMLRKNASQFQICFTLLSEEFEDNAAYKEKRCFFIHFLQNLTVRGSCVGILCQNKGFCDGSSPVPRCFCRSGFSSHDCSKRQGEVIMSSNEQVVFGDLAFPKSVNCKYDTECSVSFSVSNNSRFYTGWNGTSIDVINISYENISSSLDVIGKAVLLHKSTGTDSFCITLSSTSGASAVRCCSIVTESVYQKILPDYGQPRFIWPSPSNGTVFTCTFGQPCHVLITLSKGYNTVDCPVLKDRTDEDTPTHIFVSNFTSKCRYDVWIGSSLSDKWKTREYCFQCPASGDLAEIRCFNIYFDQHVNPSSVPTSVTTAPMTNDKTTIGQSATTEKYLQLGLTIPRHPYFVLIPTDTNLTCIHDHICKFSVYASTTNCREITSIESLPQSEESVFIRYSTKSIGMTEAKAGHIEFLPKQIGQRRICIKASDCMTFTQKCFYVTVVMPNPCEQNHCQNRGKCVSLNGNADFVCSCRYGYTGKLCDTKINPCVATNICQAQGTCFPLVTEPYFYCHCLSGRTGDRCEVDAEYQGKCAASSGCKNNAACRFQNRTMSCICRLGYKGSSCSEDANADIGSSTNTGAIFTDVALPKYVICYIAFPCPIPFAVLTSNYNKHHVAPGFSDPLLQVTSLEFQHNTSAPGIEHGVLEVMGKSLGTATVCLESVDKSWPVKITDEICFQVKVQNGSYHQQYSDVSHFVKPTFEMGSLFQCLVGTYCHLNLWAVNDIRKNNCPVLKSEKSSKKRFHVHILAALHQTKTSCLYDVALKAETTMNDTLCFYLEGDGGVYSDRRCYSIYFSPVYQKGSCAGGLCYNGGFCDGHSSTKRCFCRIGFSGENCSIDHGIAQSVHQHNSQHPLFGNVLLPKQVICLLNKECRLQFLVVTYTGFNIETNTDPGNVEITGKSEKRISKDYVLSLSIIHRKTGSHQLCLNLTSEDHSLVTDRLCCNIFTKETVIPQSACVDKGGSDCRDPDALKNICADPTSGEYCLKSCKLCDGQIKEETYQLFLPSSPTNRSTFACYPGLECHMIIYLKRGSSNVCPSISVIPSVGVFVHIFNNSDCAVCSMDILVKLSLPHHGEMVQQCFQAMDNEFGLTEKMCFFIQNARYSSP